MTKVYRFTDAIVMMHFGGVAGDDGEMSYRRRRDELSRMINLLGEVIFDEEAAVYDQLLPIEQQGTHEALAVTGPSVPVETKGKGLS